MNWRLIDTGLADPYYVTAADDDILRSNKDMKTPNTLHFIDEINQESQLADHEK